jgi:hypothetical protein
VSRIAFGLYATVAVLSGCAGAQPPIPQHSTFDQSTSSAAEFRHGASWMLPEAKDEDLLYVSDQGAGSVYVYSYPAGHLVGTLTGFNAPAGECVDTSGNVFITNFSGANIVEFAHGGTSPIATLNDSSAYPSGCSFDPKTRDLAVSNWGTYGGYAHGNVAIYKDAQGAPQTYTDPSIDWYDYCTYDNKGNLFVDGYVLYSYFLVAELPRGKSALKNIAIANPGTYAGNIQWNGKYLVVADDRGFGSGQKGPQLIDQVKVSSSTGTVINTVKLFDSWYGNSGVSVQFWIVNGKMIMPWAKGSGYNPNYLGVWRYPSGGKSIRSITGFQYALGVTVSLAPH